MKRIHILGSAAAFLLATGVAFGQATSGDVVGTVKDPSGAVLPNASVTITSESTRVSVTTKTNSSGEYRVQNLIPAKYDIRVESAGFQGYTLRGLDVQLSTTATANATLTVGNATSVEVEANAGVTLDTTSTNLTTSFSAQELNTLPIASVGFGVLNAALLSPNVGSPGGVGIGTGPSVGGQRPRNNNYTIEGIDDNDKSVTGPLVLVPNDAVGDFTLITSQFSPEFGHSSGGQFNTNVISGTNKYHGKVYEYFQNRNLNAIDATAGGKVPNPRYDANRYGGQLGGALIHDKLFAFGNYERATTGRSNQYFLCTPTTAGLATLAGLTGYGLNATNLAQYLKYTPAANYLGGGQVNDGNDQACFNNASGAQFDRIYSGTTFDSTPSDVPYPIATAAGGFFGSGASTDIPLGNYVVNAPNFVNSDQATASLDFTPNQRDSFRFRYSYLTQVSPDTSAQLPVFFTSSPYKQHFLSFSWFHNFTPNLVNELRLGFNRFQSVTPSGDAAFPNLAQFPNLQINDQDGLQLGPDPNAPQSGIQNLYQATDNVSYTRGKHTFKFGFDGRKYIAPQSFTQRVRGDYEYALLSEYLHDLSPTYFGERSSGNFFYYGDQTALYGYGNDTWRVSDKLTLNYGLRYEFTSVPVGERAQQLNIAASVPGLITFSAPQPQYKNFAPRVGVAYAPDQNTSVRAGFGMAYDVLFDNLGLLSFPPQYSSTTDVGTGFFTGYGTPAFLATGGLPAGTGTLNTYPTLAAQRKATSAYLPNQVLPYSENYNLTIQRTFAKNYTAEIQYLGTHGVHLPVQNQINVQAKATPTSQLITFINGGATPNNGTAANSTYATTATDPSALTLAQLNARSSIVPAFAAAGFTSKMTSYQPFGGSNYNGLGFNLTRRFVNGFQMNASYTWSKAMDDSTAEVNASSLTQRRPQDSQNQHAEYSRSGLDRTHRLTIEAVYDLPYFRHSNFLLKNVLGNWIVSPIYTYESPEYATVTSNTNSNLNTDSPGISRSIVNAAGDKGLSSDIIPVYSTTLAAACTDPAANGRCSASEVGYLAKNPGAYYIKAGAGTSPNAERNTLASRPIDNLTATASKRITFSDRYSFEFQAQAFNVLNHAQYVPGNIDGIGGVSTSATSVAWITAGNAQFNHPEKTFTAHARSMQLVAKFNF